MGRFVVVCILRACSCLSVVQRDVPRTSTLLQGAAKRMHKYNLIGAQIILTPAPSPSHPSHPTPPRKCGELKNSHKCKYGKGAKRKQTSEEETSPPSPNAVVDACATPVPFESDHDTLSSNETDVDVSSPVMEKTDDQADNPCRLAEQRGGDETSNPPRGTMLRRGAENVMSSPLGPPPMPSLRVSTVTPSEYNRPAVHRWRQELDASATTAAGGAAGRAGGDGMALPANIFLSPRMERLEVMVFGDAVLCPPGEHLESPFVDEDAVAGVSPPTHAWGEGGWGGGGRDGKESRCI